MCCDMICQGLALVGFVFTVGAVELEDASVSILTVLHLVKAHVSMSTLITPAFYNDMYEEEGRYSKNSRITLLKPKIGTSLCFS